jgi:hypothetical protein
LPFWKHDSPYSQSYMPIFHRESIDRRKGILRSTNCANMIFSVALSWTGRLSSICRLEKVG